MILLATSLDWLELTSSTVVFVAFASLGMFFAHLLLSPRQLEGLTTVELARRERLRANSQVYRWFEVGICDLAVWFGDLTTEEINDGQRPWKSAEVSAAGVLIGLGCGSILGTISLLIFPPVVAFLAFAGAAFFGGLMFVSQVKGAGQTRRKNLVRRLPYLVDLMALVMEAGGSFQDALRAAARENADHPIGEELGEVARKIERGVPQSEALRQFADRYPDDHVRYFVSSLNQGLDLGVPLVSILRNQSDEMLRRRSQWIEKASAEAKVKISGPGFIIALACMLIMLAPFIMQVVGGLN
ncbi:MAG: type II secretion system F family protein [Planctomycetaceae bacterium]|nr:type II secretion system F family protein [Planctomycetaceae bacterium]